MKYSGVIFDLDGVLCHTDMFHYQAWKALAEELGVYFDETINNRLRGVSRMESLSIILERYEGRPLSDAEKAKYADEKNERYKVLLGQMDKTYVSETVLRTLTALREGGVKLAIGSSSKNAALILGRIGLDGFFDALSDGNNIQHSKPHPQVFLVAADYLSLPPSRCLVVEDARAGIEAALAGGFDSAGIGDAAADERAVYQIKQLDELLPIIFEREL
ncbi:MAG: beta-phosphoglucomutase [Treponema sp.]|nr:beta-phosphoglucomutase [Treponema sp.]MCL2233066.1 beta-phosphoglucomutase [Treponema sp.]